VATAPLGCKPPGYQKPLRLRANGLHHTWREAWGNVSPTVAKASRYVTQQGLTFRRGLTTLRLVPSTNGFHLEIHLISRCATPEGLETRKGSMTLHLLHPHASPCQTVEPIVGAFGSYHTVTAASWFRNPEDLQTHGGFMTLVPSHPHAHSQG